MQRFAFYMDAGGPVMWVILALSVLGVAIVLERTVFFALARGKPFAPEGGGALDAVIAAAEEARGARKLG